MSYPINMLKDQRSWLQAEVDRTLNMLQRFREETAKTEAVLAKQLKDKAELDAFIAAHEPRDTSDDSRQLTPSP